MNYEINIFIVEQSFMASSYKIRLFIGIRLTQHKVKVNPHLSYIFRLLKPSSSKIHGYRIHTLVNCNVIVTVEPDT
jgi:hypothetical protein